MYSSIDRIVDFIAERDPEFTQQIQPASDEEIARLEDAAHRPLPPVYREFLKRMGRSFGWLKLVPARFDVSSLIKYFEFAVLPDPAGCFLIGRADEDPYYDIYLWQDSPEPLRVVSFPPPPTRNFEQFANANLRRIAGSLPQMLGDAALATFRNHQLPSHRQVESGAAAGAQTRLPQLDALLASRGIPPLWYSNDWMRTYESPDAVVNAYQSPASGRLIVDVRAATQSAFDGLFPTVRDFVKSQAA